MKMIIRDDIISTKTYLAAESKYKEYLEALYGCGGYCFLEQFERLLDGGNYLAKNMEDDNLIKTDYFSRYKFVRLTSTALKYLYYRDDERDFSGISKNKISVQNLKAKPSEKVLFNSAMNFELYYKDQEKYRYFIKENHIDLLKSQISNDYSDKIIELEKLVADYTSKIDYINFMIKNINKMVENEGENNICLSNILDQLSEDKTSIEAKKNIIMKYTTETKRVEHLHEKLNNLKTINNEGTKLMKALLDNRKVLIEEINKAKKEIEKYKTTQISSDEKTDEIIKYFMQQRDISKVICLYDITNFKLTVISTFVKLTKSGYPSLLKKFANFLFDKGYIVKSVDLNLVSIYKLNDNVMKSIRSDIKYISNTPYDDNIVEYDASLFDETIEREKDFYEWRDKTYRDTVLGGIEYSVNFGTLQKFKKYFDTIANSISYVKKKDIVQFQELKDKLANK